MGTVSAAVIFLIEESFSQKQRMAEGTRGKLEGFATSLNSTLRHMQESAEVDISLIGYHQENGRMNLGSRWSGNFAGRTWVSSSELRNSPIRVETRFRQVQDAVMGVRQEQMEFPVWYDPIYFGGAVPRTPVFNYVADILQEWSYGKSLVLPPLIISFLGDLTLEDPLGQSVFPLGRVSTEVGFPLLLQIHLGTNMYVPAIKYPTQEQFLPEGAIREMFHACSVLDEFMIRVLQESGENIISGAKGLVYNGRMVDMVRLMRLAQGYQAQYASRIPKMDSGFMVAPELPRKVSTPGVIQESESRNIHVPFMQETKKPSVNISPAEFPPVPVSPDFEKIKPSLPAESLLADVLPEILGKNTDLSIKTNEYSGRKSFLEEEGAVSSEVPSENSKVFMESISKSENLREDFSPAYNEENPGVRNTKNDEIFCRPLLGNKLIEEPADLPPRQILVILLMDRSISDMEYRPAHEAWCRRLDKLHFMLGEIARHGRERYDVSMIFYGRNADGTPEIDDSLLGRPFLPDSLLLESAGKVEEFKLQMPNGIGGLISLPRKKLYFAEVTPTLAADPVPAFQRVQDVIRKWDQTRQQKNLQPMLVHITAGQFQVERLEEAVRNLTQDDLPPVWLHHWIFPERPHIGMCCPGELAENEDKIIVRLWEQSDPLPARELLAGIRPGIMEDSRGVMVNMDFDILFEVIDTLGR
ncbi:MAG: hypothetical protein Q4C96_04875 [Planctomycetia bacterium]|nr:hypothetical protein [Planctomycetia bacterium]